MSLSVTSKVVRRSCGFVFFFCSFLRAPLATTTTSPSSCQETEECVGKLFRKNEVGEQ